MATLDISIRTQFIVSPYKPRKGPLYEKLIRFLVHTHGVVRRRVMETPCPVHVNGEPMRPQVQDMLTTLILAWEDASVVIDEAQQRIIVNSIYLKMLTPKLPLAFSFGPWPKRWFVTKIAFHRIVPAGHPRVLQPPVPVSLEAPPAKIPKLGNSSNPTASSTATSAEADYKCWRCTVANKAKCECDPLEPPPDCHY